MEDHYNKRLLAKFKNFMKSKGFKCESINRSFLHFEEIGLCVGIGRHGNFIAFNKLTRHINPIDISFSANSIGAIIKKLVKFKLISSYVVNIILSN